LGHTVDNSDSIENPINCFDRISMKKDLKRSEKNPNQLDMVSQLTFTTWVNQPQNS